MQIQKLSVNSPYPFPIDNGLKANFLSKSGNFLQLGLHDIQQDELIAFKNHPAKCGILVDLPAILFVFDFGLGGQYDAPFNAHLYKDRLDLHDITNKEQRLAIDFHVVELTNNLTKVLKLFTLPPDLTLYFLSAVQDQLAMQFSEQQYQNKLSAFYKLSIDELLEKAELYKIGT